MTSLIQNILYRFLIRYGFIRLDQPRGEFLSFFLSSHSRMCHCSRCYREFSSESALYAHCRDKNDHPYCEDCRKLFGSFDALDNVCATSYRSKVLILILSSKHMYSVHIDLDSYCTSCNREFGNQASLFQHLAASSRHNWCFICSRDFSSSSALSQV